MDVKNIANRDAVPLRDIYNDNLNFRAIVDEHCHAVFNDMLQDNAPILYRGMSNINAPNWGWTGDAHGNLHFRFGVKHPKPTERKSKLQSQIILKWSMYGG